MKFTKGIAIVLLVALAAVTMLCACNKTDEHVHEYADEWSYDETYHWQEPICGDTTEKGNLSIHNFASDGVCHLCGYAPNADKTPDYYDITYGVSGSGGRVEGELTQRVKRGGDATPVTAVPDEKFLFIMWSDGEIEAARQDINVRQSMEILAIFEPDPDDPSIDEDEDFGNDDPEEEEKEKPDTPRKGETVVSNGLQFTEMRDLTTNEVTGYTVRLAENYADFNGTIPEKFKDKPVLEIEDEGFASCSLSSITLPKTLTRIGHKGFYNCGNLKSIEIPDSVLDIGNQSFQNCYSLSSIKLSNSIQGVWYKMFYRCGSLKEIELPDSVEQIGRYAFYGCSSLQKVTFGKGIKKSGAKAFGQCSGLIGVYIKDVKAWCETTFDYFMQSLNSSFESQPLYYAHKLYLVGEDGNSALVENLEIPEGTKEITSYAFVRCQSLISVKTPTTLKMIGKMAFMDCNNLQSVDFNEGLISLQYLVFMRCYKLRNVKLPDSVTDVGIDPNAIENPGSSVFERCDELTELTIGKGLKTIDATLCTACYKLGDIYYMGTSSEWDQMNRKSIWLSECKTPFTVHCLGDKQDIIYESKWVVENSIRFPRYIEQRRETCTHNHSLDS